MMGRERCDQIIGLIDRVLAECQPPVPAPVATTQPATSAHVSDAPR